MRTTGQPTEASILKSCLAALKLRGVLAWRNNTGALPVGERFVRFGAKGSSDILGILPGGQFLAVEVKRPGRKPTAGQEAFLDAVLDAGGVAFWVDDVAKLIEWLDEAGVTNGGL